MSKSSFDEDFFVGFGASMIGNQEATRFHSPTSLLAVDGFALDLLKVFFVVLTLFLYHDHKSPYGEGCFNCFQPSKMHIDKLVVFSLRGFMKPAKDETSSLICKIVHLPLVFGAWKLLEKKVVWGNSGTPNP